MNATIIVYFNIQNYFYDIYLFKTLGIIRFKFKILYQVYLTKQTVICTYFTYASQESII